MGSTIERFLHSLEAEAGLAASTAAAYRRDLVAFGRHRGAGGFHNVTEDEVRSFLRAESDEGRDAATIARRLTALRQVYRFLSTEHGDLHDPTARIRPPHRDRRLPKALGREEVGALLDLEDLPGPLGLRERLIVEWLYGSGCRVSELVGVRLRDVDRDRGVARCTGKGGKDRLLFLHDTAWTAYDRWLAEGRPCFAANPSRTVTGRAGHVLLSRTGRALERTMIFRILRSRARRAGLRHLPSPHVLRHTFATHLVEEGADLRVVQELLGHESLSTTQVYTKTDRERLRQAHARYHPRS